MFPLFMLQFLGGPQICNFHKCCHITVNNFLKIFPRLPPTLCRYIILSSDILLFRDLGNDFTSNYISMQLYQIKMLQLFLAKLKTHCHTLGLVLTFGLDLKSLNGKVVIEIFFSFYPKWDWHVMRSALVDPTVKNQSAFIKKMINYSI